MKFYQLALRNLKEIYRDPISLLLGLAMPIVLLVLFTSIQGDMEIEMFTPQAMTPGIIVFCYAFLIMFSSLLLARDRQNSLLTRLFTTPLKPSDYILAYVLPFIPIAFFQTLICLVTGIILGGTFAHIGVALLVFTLLAVICICLGITFGALFTVNQTSGIGSIFITAIGLFSGVWMNLKVVGGVFETIGYALPFAHAVDASREILAGASLADVTANLYWVTAYAVGTFLLAIWAFRWSMRRV